jgi:predicted transcriptional regulator
MTARFSVVPAVAFEDVRLTPADVRVLGILGSFLDRKNECFPSQALIAERGKLNRSTVNGSLKKLVQLGYVQVRQKWPGKARSVLVYRVLLDVDPAAVADDMQAELFPDEVMEARQTAAKSHVGNSNIETAETPQNRMLEIPTSMKLHVGSGPNNVVASGPNNVVASGPNTNSPSNSPTELPSSVSNETGLSAAEDDSEEVSPPSSQELKRSIVFNTGRLLLSGHGVPKKTAGSFLGRLVKDYGLDACFAAVTAASREPPGDPQAWLVKSAELHARKLGRKLPDRASAAKPEVDWNAAVSLYVRRGTWPRHLGDRPDEARYSGPVEPLEAIMANGQFQDLDVNMIRLNIDRLRAARAA